MEGIGTIAAIGGAILVLVLIWAVVRNGQRSKADVRRTEEAAHNLHKQIDREDRVSDPDPARY